MSDVMLPRTLLDAGPEDSDWGDVVRRVSRARRRRRVGVVAALAAVVAVSVASAYALGHPIVDFRTSPKGPIQIVNDFGSLEVGAPLGMAPGVLPHEARRITSVTIDGKPHVLWVAPTKRGGFCAQWSHAFGGCRADRHDAFSSHIDVSISGVANGCCVAMLGGSFFQRGGDRLEVSYADGATAEIPFVWVTEPIDAGFYLYRVPDAHRVEAARPTAVTLYDDHSKTLAREEVQGIPASVRSPVEHRIDGYPSLFSVPPEAIWEERQQLFDLHADDGTHIGLWVAPELGGGTCFWSNQAAGCTRVEGRASEVPTLALGFSGGEHVTLCCQVGAGVARVEARFEDGERVDLTPKRGYLIWPIPSRHYPRGHRLELLVAYEDGGRELTRQRVEPNTSGLYPCKKPSDLGYGVYQCP
jgi:hypothetical protein